MVLEDHLWCPPPLTVPALNPVPIVLAPPAILPSFHPVAVAIWLKGEFLPLVGSPPIAHDFVVLISAVFPPVITEPELICTPPGLLAKYKPLPRRDMPSIAAQLPLVPLFRCTPAMPRVIPPKPNPDARLERWATACWGAMITTAPCSIELEATVAPRALPHTIRGTGGP